MTTSILGVDGNALWASQRRSKEPESMSGDLFDAFVARDEKPSRDVPETSGNIDGLAVDGLPGNRDPLIDSLPGRRNPAIDGLPVERERGGNNQRPTPPPENGSVDPLALLTHQLAFAMLQAHGPLSGLPVEPLAEV